MAVAPIAAAVAALILVIDNLPPGAARDAHILNLDQMNANILDDHTNTTTLRAFGRWANAFLPAPAPYLLVNPIVREVQTVWSETYLVNYLIAQANVYAPGPQRDNIVRALRLQTTFRTPPRDVLTDALAHLATIYPPGFMQYYIIQDLIVQAEWFSHHMDRVVRPQHQVILRALDSIVVGPPAVNIVNNIPIGNLNDTQKHLLETYTRTRGVHGAVIPVPPAVGNWRFVRVLGTGGESTAHLYLHLDNSSRVTDRVVQRIVAMDYGVWNLPDIWEPNTAIGTNPKESWIMAMFPPNPNIVHLRNTVLDRPNYTFIHYVDFVEHGNLTDLILQHARQSRRNTSTPSSGRRRYRMEDPAPFDESFLWHLFRSLVRGLNVMDNAAAQQAHPPLSMPEIVHGDLHTGNVFLGAEDPASFRLYPTPKIADFGFTHVSHANDPRNRMDFDILRGHYDFRPPELIGPRHGFIHFGAPDAVKALASANIYQIGLLMVCAMRLQVNLQPPIDLHAPDIHAANGQGILPNAHRTTLYTQALVDLVHSCLAFHPANRPNAETLLRQIQAQGAAHFGPGNAEFVGVGPGLPKPSLDPRSLRCGLSDQYRVGLRYPPRRPRRQG